MQSVSYLAKRQIYSQPFEKQVCEPENISFSGYMYRRQVFTNEA